MELSQIDQILSLSIKGGGILVSAITCAWALNKFFLQSTYVTKQEIDSKLEASRIESSKFVERDLFKEHQEIFKRTDDSVNKLEKEFAVFKQSYEGNNELIKTKITHTEELVRQQISNQAEFRKEVMNELRDIKTQTKN